MHCLCGKKMTLLMSQVDKIMPLKLWSCPPDGCGRLYLQGSKAEVTGTWYYPEQNDKPRILGD